LVVYDYIATEIKAQQSAIEDHYKQVINYLAVSKLKLGLIVNFGENSLKFKRVVL
ncbi:MAG TPA: GxxExxY protein, partial [Bacteroidia bacterium]|nr:GxxExxY protein [Bacteroidia bacterium]